MKQLFISSLFVMSCFVFGQGFMADKEWKDIKVKTAKLHGDFVNHMEGRTLKLTEFSPQKKLLK